MASDDERLSRVGLVVPPANSAVELEFRKGGHPQAALFTARLPAHSDGRHGSWDGLEGRLNAYLDALPATASQLAGLELSTTYLACTALSYLPAVASEKQLVDCFPSGCGRVVTAAGLVSAYLATFSGARIAFLTPYPTWLTSLAVEHYSEAGREIEIVREVRADSGIYAVGEAEVLEAVAEVETEADVVLIGGTGVHSAHIVNRLRAGGREVASANWLALQHVSHVATAG